MICTGRDVHTRMCCATAGKESGRRKGREKGGEKGRSRGYMKLFNS